MLVTYFYKDGDKVKGGCYIDNNDSYLYSAIAGRIIERNGDYHSMMYTKICDKLNVSMDYIHNHIQLLNR